jgi:hypothetical protein
MKAYFERQINWGILALCVPIIVWILSPIGRFSVILPLIYPLLFHCKIDTHIDDTHITIVYGVGLSKKIIAINKIYNLSIVKLKWYQGFSKYAIDLKFRGSKEMNQTARIESKDVERLKQAIEARM